MPDPTRSSVIPCLRYRDAPAAIAWLEQVIGFRRQLVVPGPEGTVAHAQLILGGGMVMIASVTDSPYGRLVQQPAEAHGRETQSPYVVVPDVDAVHARAVAAGAAIVLPLKDEDYGGRGCSFRDPEGHLWNVGTYDPWAQASVG